LRFLAIAQQGNNSVAGCPVANKLYVYFSDMTTAVLIGTGNVARHLFDAFQASASVRVLQVLGRSEKALAFFRNQCETGPITAPPRAADVYIIAVSDSSITAVSQLLKLKNCLVVHTSGSKEAGALSGSFRKGVFYPLQTFSIDRKINFREVPVCIEAEDADDLGLMRALAGSISGRVCELSFTERRQLHLAAVFVNNFGNHLSYLADKLLQAHRLPFDLLLPLIRETAAKLEQLTPLEAQTGPARRGDTKTLAEHRQLLQDGTHAALYDLMSKSIQTTYAKDL
jgi:predicted short-subunit dehydrogenase-like oxidoreductase (DUF2520 family)